MIVTSTGIVNGTILDQYGKRGTQFLNSMPTYSLPFVIEGAPPQTESYAFILEDEDAIPVSGFSWIHWLGANLKRTRVEENESLEEADFLQGKNSWGVNLYGGMAPPNAPHQYDLHVYALDCTLDLTDGFSVEALRKAMQGHILAEYTLSGQYAD